MPVLPAVSICLPALPCCCRIRTLLIRLRPILMTSFTFVLGVMPLLFATGAGAGSRVALGAAVVFGMAVNTIFATIYIPNWYEVMQNIQEKWLTKKK